MNVRAQSNWQAVNLEDISEIVRGLAFPTTDKSFAPSEGTIACLRTTNVQRNVEWHDLWFIPKKHVRHDGQRVRIGDVLISTANSFELVGKVAQVKSLPYPATLGAFISLIRPDCHLNGSFLFYQLTSSTIQSKIRGMASTTTNISNVSTGKLRELRLILAPLPEQRRIVDEIEKQFTRLDAATAALKRVQANLKRYRASVLKAACEGRLVPTEAELARKEGRDYEPADKLLQRILRERRARWEADTLAKMQAAGKPPKDDHWKQKYSIPELPDATGLSGLPEGWAWASPDQLSAADDNAICAGPFGTIFKAKDFRSEGTPIIFLRHVSAGRYLTHKPGFMDSKIWAQLFRAYSVFGGELLITKLGDPPGVCAIYPEGSGPAMVTPDVIKLSVNDSGVYGRYLMHYINGDRARQFSTGACFGTTRLRLTLPIFRTMPVALPPTSEQIRIASEIDRHLSNTDALSSSAEAQLLRATALRQSALRSAFTGQLVRQDPTDEPAAVLLERIRAERASASTPQPTRRSRKEHAHA